MNNEYLTKIIIIGDCSVGKTNILIRYCQNKFKNNYTATIGVDFKIKSIQVHNTRIKMQIWDTAGQQRYNNIVQTYFKGAAGVILTYSVCDQKSFTNVEKWMKQVNTSGDQNMIKILVGNKCDVSDQERQIQTSQGKDLAQKYKIPFFQVSAKTGDKVQQIFQELAQKIVQQYIPKMLKEEQRMQLKPSKNKTNKCNC